MAASTAMHELRIMCRASVTHGAAAYNTVLGQTHRILSMRATRSWRGMAGLLGALGVLACGGDATGPSTALDLDHTFWALRFNQHAVTLALTPSQDTIHLTATPLNVNGQPLSLFGPVQYSATDSTVTVDAMGLVTAQHVNPFQKAAIVAILTDTVHHITKRDSCFIQVTSTAPTAPLSVFTVQLTPSALLPLGSSKTLRATATDANGNTVSSFPYFTVEDSSIATVDKFTGSLTGLRLGQVMVHVETWAYGVAKRDSFLLTVGLASNATISVLPVAATGSTHPILTFWPQITRVAAGAVVMWVNNSYTDSIDVLFDDTTNVDSAQYANIRLRFGTGRGDISPWLNDTLGTSDVAARECTALGGTPPGPSCVDALKLFPQARQRLRKFPVAGTYHYHSAKWGTSGTIVVQ